MEKRIVEEKKITASNLDPKQPKITVVLDIDAVLAVGVESELESRTYFPKKEFFTDRGLMLEAAGLLHFLHPATTAFIRALFSKENLDIAFFSSGAKIRNEELVPKILKLALGEHDKTPKIFSRDHLVAGEHRDKEKPYPELLGDFFGNHKKDLRTVVGEEGLPYTVLIDDDYSWAVVDQGKNLLKVQGLDVHDYHDSSPIATLNEETLTCDIVRRYNNLYYGTGMLCELFDELEKSGTARTVPEVLFELQYKGEERLSDSYWKRAQEERFYHRGLAHLRQYQQAEYPLEFFFSETVNKYKG
jgi:hypothetical protein